MKRVWIKKDAAYSSDPAIIAEQEAAEPVKVVKKAAKKKAKKKVTKK